MTDVGGVGEVLRAEKRKKEVNNGRVQTERPQRSPMFCGRNPQRTATAR